MADHLFKMLETFRPCFSRETTYGWFVLIMIGMLVRMDHYGVSSIVRWLSLTPKSYLLILHFYHSTGWSLQSVLNCWWDYCFNESMRFKVNGRNVLIGDHTNQPKDGRKMPGVVTIHQDSETATKPSYYRGHVWGFLALLVGNAEKCLAVPLWGELNNKERNERNSVNMSTSLVHNAINIALKRGECIYLTLDAFFAVGPVFLAASQVYHTQLKVQLVHIITRAKKNSVAYEDPEPSPPGKRGRKAKYGEKVKLIDLFAAEIHHFIEAQVSVYGKQETIKLLCRDLFWKPIDQKVRFVLAITSRGPIILMSSDLLMSSAQILEMYCRRVSIETMFSVLKNLMGGLSYHFWCKALEKSSRRPKKNSQSTTPDKKIEAKVIERKIQAIEMFVTLSAILVGILQLLALRFSKEIWEENTHWLRTTTGAIPSEYIVKSVLVQTIFRNLHKVNGHAIYRLIKSRGDPHLFKKAA